ncbi:MAG: choice-of-anchor R domain-containing protein [Verrucomicrobiota bacterium]
MIRALPLILLSLSLAPFGSTAHAATPLVTAEYVLQNGSSTPSFTPGDPNLRLAQTFTPLVAGILDGIGVTLTENGVLPPSVTVTITETSSGQPSGTLGSAIISAPALTNTATLFTADFSGQGINLNTGTLYAIVLSPSPPGGYSWNGDNPGSYAGGNYFFSNDAGSNWNDSTIEADRGFRVTVIPEPSSTLLLSLSTLAIAIRRRS